jgi:hypothetical protein
MVTEEGPESVCGGHINRESASKIGAASEKIQSVEKIQMVR